MKGHEALWITILIYIPFCLALYEDQVGKFEWRQQYIGKAKSSYLDIISPTKKLIVATEENVLAALNLKSGELLWRQIFETGKEGIVQLLEVDDEIVTVLGTRTPLVRGWDLETGHILFEWSPQALVPGLRRWWSVQEVSLIVYELSHGEVFIRWLGLRNGVELARQRLGTDALEEASCVAKGPHLACLDQEGVLTIVSLQEPGNAQVSHVKVESIGDATDLAVVDGRLAVVAVVGKTGQKLVTLPEGNVIHLSIPADAVVSFAPADDLDYILITQLLKGKLVVKTYSVTGEELPELQSSVPWSSATGLPEKASGSCQIRRDKSVACRVSIVASDHSLVMLQHPGVVLWTREEALASILAVELVDLPVSDTDAAMESEFGNKNVGFIGMLGRRLYSQWCQLEGILAVFGMDSSTTGKTQGLVRDEFGLHKLIVAVTSPGKVFGIDNLSGEIVWQVLADLAPLGTTISPSYALFLLRSAIHPPHPAKLAILGKSVDQTAVLTLNPITGESEPLRKFSSATKQAIFTQIADETHMKAIILLDNNGEIQIHPEKAVASAVLAAENSFLYTVDPSTGIVEGYKLLVKGTKISAVRSWVIRLGQDDARVVIVAAKRDTERVHSQGRVMGDRSVLYKYVNPNLVAIFTQGYHPSHKNILNVYLIDVVSGLVVYSSSHRRAREPIHAVHSENWLVYSWVSEKNRRTEVAAVELYEGTFQSNDTAFSSFASPPLLPIVEKQAYILPANVLALRDTLTEKGITNKHIMVALANGAILELPWLYLDPRRTMMVTPEMREEGVIPYIPELPIPFEAIINYNLTVSNVRGILTAPSGIESTSLLFAYGLDIFYTRVAPSKTFDLLKEDFDYFTIAAVLLGLILASVVTKRLSSRKALKQAWK